MKNSQLTFWQPAARAHGGAVSVGREKKARPIATKRPMHLIFRSSRAKGAWSFLHSRHRDRLEAHLRATARRFGVKVYRFANVGNHFHLLVQARHREDMQNFLRVFAQGVVFLVTGACKGNPVGKFWDALAYSRIVEWGKDWKGMLEYVGKESTRRPRHASRSGGLVVRAQARNFKASALKPDGPQLAIFPGKNVSPT